MSVSTGRGEQDTPCVKFITQYMWMPYAQTMHRAQHKNLCHAAMNRKCVYRASCVYSVWAFTNWRNVMREWLCTFTNAISVVKISKNTVLTWYPAEVLSSSYGDVAVGKILRAHGIYNTNPSEWAITKGGKDERYFKSVNTRRREQEIPIPKISMRSTSLMYNEFNAWSTVFQSLPGS